MGRPKKHSKIVSYMTTSEFAKIINIHPQTLRKWDNDGTLPAHHKTPGGRRYYTQEQADKFLNNR